MAVGGDQGGSVRIPASFTGIVGLKATWGLVPYTGASSIEPTVDHLGPMAKTVTNCALLLEVWIHISILLLIFFSFSSSSFLRGILFVWFFFGFFLGGGEYSVWQPLKNLFYSSVSLCLSLFLYSFFSSSFSFCLFFSLSFLLSLYFLTKIFFTLFIWQTRNTQT